MNANRPQVIHAPTSLSEDEVTILKMFVEGPAYKILVKVVENDAVNVWHKLLESTDKIDEVWRLQGRIQGARYLQNVPKLLVSAADSKAKRET